MDPIQEFVDSEEKASILPTWNLETFLRNHPVLYQVLYSVLALVLGVSRGCGTGPCTEGQFDTHMYRYPLELASGHRCYELYVTDTYDPNQAWPLILFGHGVLESGDDGYAHLSVGIGPALSNFPQNYPCLVAMPQLPWNVTEEETKAIYDATLADVQARYAIDPNRIYMTGISYGAAATWHYAAINPGVFAAILPIAGSGRRADIPALLDIPIRTFAAQNDELGDTTKWETFVQELEDAGADITASVLPGSSHDIWDRVYRSQDVINWLLSQSLGP